MENKITLKERDILREQIGGLMSRVARTGGAEPNRWRDLMLDKLVEAAGWLQYWHQAENPIQMEARVDFAKTEKNLEKN